MINGANGGSFSTEFMIKSVNKFEICRDESGYDPDRPSTKKIKRLVRSKDRAYSVATGKLWSTQRNRKIEPTGVIPIWFSLRLF